MLYISMTAEASSIAHLKVCLQLCNVLVVLPSPREVCRKHLQGSLYSLRSASLGQSTLRFPAHPTVC